jgi:hypothetical protein
MVEVLSVTYGKIKKNKKKHLTNDVLFFIVYSNFMKFAYNFGKFVSRG